MAGIFTAQECDEGHPAVNRQRINVLLPMCTSDEIDYHINTLAVGRFLHLFCEIVAGVIHGMSRPIRYRKEPIQLLPGGRRRCNGVPVPQLAHRITLCKT